jgi:gamma-glutamylcyclotransferase (GGCT)/AIG2-like uncharacterized protein YtfP
MFSIQQLKFLDLNKDRTFYIFAYGRLKRGYCYNEYIDNDTNKYLWDTVTVDKTSLYMMNNFPLMSDMGNFKGLIKGELYEIDCETLLSLDNLFSNQDRTLIILENNIKAHCYKTNIKLLSKEVMEVNGVIEWKT